MDLTEFVTKHGQAWEGFFVRSDMGRDFFAMLETLSPKPEPDKAGDANVALQFVARYDQHRKLVDTLKSIKFAPQQEQLETTFQGPGYEESVEQLKKQTEAKPNG